MSVLAMTAASLRRILRDRLSLFFLVVLPVLVILIIGTVVGNQGTFRVGLVVEGQGPLADRVVAALDASPALHVRRFTGDAAVRTALRRGELETAVVVPASFDRRLTSGSDAALTVYADQANSNQQAAAEAVDAVLADVGARLQAARFAAAHVGGDLATNLPIADRTTSSPIEVRSIAVDATSDYLPTGFSYSAPTMLILFVFINAVAAGGAMIESRQLGVYDRMLAGPVRPGAIVLGETGCYLLVAVLQSVLIIGIGAGLFGVSWGDPVGAAALVAAWALVGTGAGMLSGTLFRTAEQASSIGPTVGIAFGMLGGCMWPLAIVPRFMRLLGHAVPQSWAVDAWTTLLSRHGTVADITRPLVVLLAFGLGLVALASVRLRVRLLR